MTRKIITKYDPPPVPFRDAIGPRYSTTTISVRPSATAKQNEMRSTIS